MSEARLKLKTYSHLMENKKIPSDYEIVSQQLNYWTQRGFAVKSNWEDWLKQEKVYEGFIYENFSEFIDPRHTTYNKYVNEQKIKEDYVEGLMQTLASEEYNDGISLEWRKDLSVLLGVLRFPYHGLQMCAAYLGQTALDSKITIACSFQAADEMRKIERFACRLGDLKRWNQSFDLQSRRLWKEEECLQKTRKLIENLLITYNWGEAFIALNLCFKPMFDQFLFQKVGLLAKKHNDFLFQEVLRSLNEDSLWHQAWSKDLYILMNQDNNQKEIERCHLKWNQETCLALEELWAGVESGKIK